MTTPSLEQAYQYCQQVAARHYENFPVASRLLPARLRRPVAVIYTFARQADDFADEGDYPAAERLRRLDAWEDELWNILTQRPSQEPVFIALADVVKRHALPVQLFADLLSAFRQDVTKTRYADFAELQDYCRRSANPVGRLLLHLHEDAGAENLQLSDQICTALQLINFLQDLQQDYREHRRIYLPQDEMAAAGVTERHLAEQISDRAMQDLIDRQLQRAEALLRAGAPLGDRLRGRFGLEIRLIIQAAGRVLGKLQQHEGDVFRRPRLKRRDYAGIVLAALWPFGRG
jgi:squalene synthase HpnC